MTSSLIGVHLHLVNLPHLKKDVRETLFLLLLMLLQIVK